jgi:hypothetical protein
MLAFNNRFDDLIPSSPLQYSTEGKIKEPNLLAEAGQGLKSAVTAYAQKDMRGLMTAGVGLFKTATGNTQKIDEYARATKTSPADVVGLCFSLLRQSLDDWGQISWSGCKDSQTSADTVEAGAATGAMSYVGGNALIPINR